MSHSDDLTAPLLSPPSPTIITTTVSDDPPISYTHSPRPLRDLPFLLLFLLLTLSSLSLGILSIARHNPNHSPSSFSFHPNSSSCLPSNSNSNSILSYSSSSFQIVNNEHLIFALLITALLCPLLALSLLFLLRRFARHLIYSSLPLFILAPSFLNLYWFVSCTLSDSCSDSFPLPYRILLLIFIFLLIALILWIIIANWHRIELTIHIIQIAATALEQNLGLFIALPVINFGVLVYLVPLVVFLVFARWNGKVVAREKGDGGWECVWRQEKWVGAYFGLVIVTMIWTVAAMVETQVYVISGTIAQWYFAVEEEEEGKKKPKRSIRSSMRNAFGPSFGTVCFSGMVMGAIRVVRAIVDSAQHEENAQGFVNLILKCCADVLLSAFDFVNKFTINFAAITGEAYCSSARMSYELLKRNLLSAVFVETVSTRVLAGIIFVLSTLYAIAVYAILNAVSHLDVEVYIIAALAWLLLILVLGYFVHVLDNVIDTIYVCYAIDRDKGEVCMQEVHEVYVMLPISRKNRPSLVDRTPLIV